MKYRRAANHFVRSMLDLSKVSDNQLSKFGQAYKQDKVTSLGPASTARLRQEVQDLIDDLTNNSYVLSNFPPPDPADDAIKMVDTPSVNDTGATATA
jgi:hypothetical protein